MTDLDQAVRTVVERCLAIQPGESVLVVCDPTRVQIGEALLNAATNLGADPVLTVLPPKPERGTEPPPTVAAAFAACDVFLAPCLPSLSHTKARKAASEQGARGATLPGVDVPMLERLMTGDFDAMAQRSQKVAELLTRSDEAHFTCPRGSDMRFDLSNREGISDDGLLRNKSDFGNLPPGEGFISPTSGTGHFVARTIGHFGLAEDEVTLTVEDGRLTEATGSLGVQLVAHLTSYGEDGRHLAELGIGTNERAQLTGNLLEDEKLLGTLHIAFGASAGIGGTVAVPVHEDCVVLEPTLTVGDTTVIDAGQFVL